MGIEEERWTHGKTREDFKGLKFRVRDFRGKEFNTPKLRKKVLELVTKEPTIIQIGLQNVHVTVRAPTIIEPGIEINQKLTVDSYAPILVGNTLLGCLEAYLRDNSAIGTFGSGIEILAAPYLELHAKNIKNFNGKENDPEYPMNIYPPQEKKGIIFIKGFWRTRLNFEYA